MKLTTKHTKDTENFALFFRSARRVRSGERGLLARSARQLAENNFRRQAAGECRQAYYALSEQEPRLQYARIIIDDATVVDCRGVDLLGLSSGADTSCRFPGAA